MKKSIPLFCLITASAFAQPAAPAEGTAPRPPRPGQDKANDQFYKLGNDSKPQDGVPQGKFSEAKVIPSKVFPGTQHTYWVYVPAQYDPEKPAALMIFNDGHAMMAEPGDVQGHRVLDNLIYRREIPVMLGVFINPGRRPDQPEPNRSEWGDRTTNRPEEYNAPDDRYARVIVDELMPELKKEYNISPDPEHRGIMGASSGGCAAFGVAWFRSNDFRKVITFVGSFVDLRGGHVWPEMVEKSPKRPIRLFMQDGRNDNRQPQAGQPETRLVLSKRAAQGRAGEKGLRPELHLGHRQPRPETRRRDFPGNDALAVAGSSGFRRPERRRGALVPRPGPMTAGQKRSGPTDHPLGKPINLGASQSDRLECRDESN